MSLVEKPPNKALSPLERMIAKPLLSTPRSYIIPESFFSDFDNFSLAITLQATVVQ